ncbi:MAG: hypothetical protein AAFO06_15025 [Cyanobacteria bacterium J06597_16]
MPEIIRQQTATETDRSTDTSKRRFRLNSFGFRLFSMIMGGAIVGIGGMGFLFGETVKYQAEEQIEKIIEGKVSSIHEVTEQAETLAYSLGVSVSTLHVRGAQTAGTYQELTRQLFQARPTYVVGLGVGQKEFGILTDRDWFYPSYRLPSEATAPETSAPENASTMPSDDREARDRDLTASSLYRNLATEPEPYHQSDRYRSYFLTQKNTWTTPYQSDRGTLLTHYSQIFDDKGEWLGTAVVDIDRTYLNDLLSGTVYKSGGKLILLSQSGAVIADPSAPVTDPTLTYQDIPELSAVWPSINPKVGGFVEGAGGYWSYAPIPDEEWMVLAYVPYTAVFGRVLLITLGATTLVGLLLAGLVALSIRYLNRRLRPVIDECQRLSEIDDEMSESLQSQDELEQLSFSFFNLLDQLKLSQTQVQLEAAHATEIQAQLKQVEAQSLSSQRRQQQVSQKLSSLSRVNAQLADIEEAMMATDSEVQKQTGLVTQLQSWIETTENLSQTLVQQLASVTALGDTAQGAIALGKKDNESIAMDLTMFRQTTQQMAVQIRTLFTAAEEISQMSKKHQRVTNTAQVLLLNASTISISASRNNNPQDFAKLAEQFQDKETQLRQLSEQLLASQNGQQESIDHLQSVVSDLRLEISGFDQAVRGMRETIDTSIVTLSRGQKATQTLNQNEERTAEANQQMVDQMQRLRQTLQKMSDITSSTTQQVAIALQQTRSVERITKEATSNSGANSGEG